MSTEMKRILVTGACGQIGSELAMELRQKYGGDNIVTAGHKAKPFERLLNSGPFEFIDVTNRETVEAIVKKYKIDTIYHMAALLFITWLLYSQPQARRILSYAGM